MVDFGPLFLTFYLAIIVTVILLIIGTPLAWWLATTRSKLKPIAEALTALPLVLPPTVLGFYLLILFNPNSALGAFWVNLTGESLTFSFAGLVIASVIYSLPFMVQPLQSAFEGVGTDFREAAASLRASPRDTFFKSVAPLSKRGFLTACILTFAHTLGEFGVILMVGGNIPGRTKVMSIAIYEHVETLQYAQAHILSAILLGLSFCVLLFIYIFNRRYPVHVG
jgi:molybdate transport system permease protein